MLVKAPFKVTFVFPFGRNWPWYVTEVWQAWGRFTKLYTHAGPTPSKEHKDETIYPIH